MRVIGMRIGMMVMIMVIMPVVVMTIGAVRMIMMMMVLLAMHYAAGARTERAAEPAILHIGARG